MSDIPNTTQLTNNQQASNQSNNDYTITDEPIFYGTAIVFAFLTTLLTGLLGISWLMPALQTIALTLFMFPLVRRGRLRQALLLLFGWLLLQFVLVMFLSMGLPGRMELTIADGFDRRTGMLAWFYASDLAPAGLIESLGSRLLEILAIVIGSIVTAGLVGFWLLIRGVNLAAFYSGTILAALSDTANGIGAFPIWTILRLGGYALISLIGGGMLITEAEPFNRYIQRRRTLLFWALGLTLLGLIFELILPDLWRTWFS